MKKFVGEYDPEEFLLNPGKPIAVGPYSVSNYAMEAKKNQEDAMENAKAVILEVAKKFYKMSGRKYGLFEEYKTKDAGLYHADHGLRSREPPMKRWTSFGRRERRSAY